MAVRNEWGDSSISLMQERPENPNELQDRICVGFMIVFLLLFTIGVARKQQDVLKEEISCTIQSMQELPESYTLEEAIQEGYYYEEEGVNRGAKDVVAEFLNCVDRRKTASFKKVMKVGKELCLTYVYYSASGYSVVQYLTQADGEKGKVAQKEYKYFIQCQDVKGEKSAYYLTNEEELYGKYLTGKLTREELLPYEVYYVFSKDGGNGRY